MSQAMDLADIGAAGAEAACSDVERTGAAQITRNAVQGS